MASVKDLKANSKQHAKQASMKTSTGDSRQQGEAQRNREAAEKRAQAFVANLNRNAGK
jgi:hypothetical protein